MAKTRYTDDGAGPEQVKTRLSGPDAADDVEGHVKTKAIADSDQPGPDGAAKRAIPGDDDAGQPGPDGAHQR